MGVLPSRRGLRNRSRETIITRKSSDDPGRLAGDPSMAVRFLRIVLPVLAMFAAFPHAARSAEKERPLAHMVFFTLKDHSSSARKAFIASCKKYLTDHEGTVSFSVGAIAEDVEEPVSVRDFDVALHVVFESKAAEQK